MTICTIQIGSPREGIGRSMTTPLTIKGEGQIDGKVEGVKFVSCCYCCCSIASRSWSGDTNRSRAWRCHPDPIHLLVDSIGSQTATESDLPKVHSHHVIPIRSRPRYFHNVGPSATTVWRWFDQDMGPATVPLGAGLEPNLGPCFNIPHARQP